MRVFFAVRLAPDEAALLAPLAGRLAGETGGRAIAAANLHLTLAFVGTVDDAQCAALQRVGTQVAATTGPFGIVLDRLGRFARAQVAWIGPSSVPAPLADLAHALVQGCVAAGLPVDERPFAPHVTLVRRARRDPLATQAPRQPLAVPAFELMASVSMPAGVTYPARARFALAGAGMRRADR